MSRVWRFGDDVNTDQIVPGRYAPYMTSEAELRKYPFIEARPEFAATVQPGDLIVAGATSAAARRANMRRRRSRWSASGRSSRRGSRASFIATRSTWACRCSRPTCPAGRRRGSHARSGRPGGWKRQATQCCCRRHLPSCARSGPRAVSSPTSGSTGASPEPPRYELPYLPDPRRRHRRRGDPRRPRGARSHRPARALHRRAAAGWAAFERGGEALPAETLAAVRAADATLFGAVGSPLHRAPGYRSPVVGLRRALDLYACVRPVQSPPLPGARARRRSRRDP